MGFCSECWATLDPYDGTCSNPNCDEFEGANFIEEGEEGDELFSLMD